jgi:membrane protease YdiL (CAAX protease family)
MNGQRAGKPAALKIIIHCILFYALMVLAELIAALSYGLCQNQFGAGDIVSIVVLSIVQVAMSYLFAVLYIKFVFKSTPADFRIKKPKTPLIWVPVAMIVPVLVWAVNILFVPGEIVIVQKPPEILREIIIFTFVSVALRAALTEELQFRSGVFHFFELRFGKIAALIVSSIAFGCVHIFNFTAEGLSAVFAQIPYLVSTAILGVFFVLLAVASDSVFVPVITHFMWNFFLGGSLFNIGSSPDGVINYVVRSNSPLINGDEMISLPQLGVIGATAVLVFIIYRKQKTKV